VYKQPVRRVNKLATFMCWLSKISVSFTLPGPSVPFQTCIGIAVPLPSIRSLCTVSNHVIILRTALGGETVFRHWRLLIMYRSSNCGLSFPRVSLLCQLKQLLLFLFFRVLYLSGTTSFMHCFVFVFKLPELVFAPHCYLRS